MDTRELRVVSRRLPNSAETVERLGDKFMFMPDGCWEWTGARTGLYGVTRIKGGPRRTYFAHRVMYELVVGPIPEGLTIDHLCRNPRCVNPAHLEPVTMRENLLRGEGRAGLNARKTHCPEGHPFAGENVRIWRNQRLCKECRRVQCRAAYQRRRARLNSAAASPNL